MKTRSVLAALLVTSGVAAADGMAPRAAQDFDAPHVEPGATSSEYRTYEYAKRGDRGLRLFAFEPSGASKSRAAILLFHSGGWTRGRPEWLFGLARRFADDGLVAIPVEYRLSKDAVTPIDALADACDAFRWVRSHAAELKVNPDRVAGWGASAGGQLVAATSTAGCGAAPPSAPRGNADLLVLVSAGVDTAHSEQFRKLTGLDETGAAAYSPLAHVKKPVPPAVIISGAEDSVAKLEAHRLFCQKARELGGSCVVHEYPRLGHLLTRRLDDQRSTIDPDPVAEEDAAGKQESFLRKFGYAQKQEVRR